MKKTVVLVIIAILSTMSLHAQSKQRIVMLIQVEDATYSISFTKEAYELVRTCRPGIALISPYEEKQMLHQVTFDPNNGEFSFDKDANFTDQVLCFNDDEISTVDSVAVITEEVNISGGIKNINLKLLGHNSNNTIDVVTISQGIVTDITRVEHMASL